MDSQNTKKSPHETERSGWPSWFEIQIKNPWFFIIVWSLGVPTFAFSVYVLFHIYFLQRISSDGQTDYPVLIAAILTALIAAFTLLVTWYIKDEAEGIGDKIITSTVIHRHLDRMVHEYSQILLKTYDESRTKEEPGVYFQKNIPLMTSWWFVNNHKKEFENNFFGNLMPGNSGRDFSGMVGFDDLLIRLSSNTASTEDHLKLTNYNEIYLKKIEYIKLLCNEPDFYIPDDSRPRYEYEAIANHDKNFGNEDPDSPFCRDDDESDNQDDFDGDALADKFFKEEQEKYDEEVRIWREKLNKLESDIVSLLHHAKPEDGKKTTNIQTDENSWVSIPKTAAEIVPFGNLLKKAKDDYNKEINSMNDDDNDRIRKEFEDNIRKIDEYLKKQDEFCVIESEIKILGEKIVASGSAIHNIMKGLGWHLPLSFEFREIEEKVEEIYSGLDGTTPPTPQPVQ